MKFCIRFFKINKNYKNVIDKKDIMCYISKRCDFYKRIYKRRPQSKLPELPTPHPHIPPL